MRQSLWRAVGDNTFALPLAAGVLYPFALSPEVAAISMSGSTLIAAIDGLILIRTGLAGIRQPGQPASAAKPCATAARIARSARPSRCFAGMRLGYG